MLCLHLYNNLQNDGLDVLNQVIISTGMNVLRLFNGLQVAYLLDYNLPRRRKRNQKKCTKRNYSYIMLTCLN